MVSCANPSLCIHECKFKVDGVSKTVETHRFVYDQVFDERSTNELVYRYSLGKYIDIIHSGGILTCFAYGQTGSGKTYTMQGIEKMAIGDLFGYAQAKGKYDQISHLAKAKTTSTSATLRSLGRRFKISWLTKHR